MNLPVPSKMIPPINQSLRQIGPVCWSVGTLICERIDTFPPADAIAYWEDDGSRYIMRKPKDSENSRPPLHAHASSEVQLIHEGGTLAAVWRIGQQALCKVKIWDPRMESEAESIAFCKEAGIGHRDARRHPLLG